MQMRLSGRIYIQYDLQMVHTVDRYARYNKIHIYNVSHVYHVLDAIYAREF